LPEKKDITHLLEDLNAGKAEAQEVLLPLLYNELRALARYHMRDERSDHTLQTTALVHEAYLRLCGRKAETWENKAHYMRVATRAMRRVLVDHARRKYSDKRGGSRRKEPLEMADGFQIESTIDLIALDTALEKLTAMDPRLGQIVELRFFGGLTAEETAHVLGVSPRTIKYEWKMAKVWLKHEME